MSPDEVHAAAQSAVPAVQRAVNYANDLTIAAGFTGTGFKISDRVTTAAVGGTGVVVGLTIFSGKKYALVHFEGASVPHLRQNSHINSTYHSLVPRKEIWAVEISGLEQASNLATNAIEDQLAQLGLRFGQTVNLSGYFEGVSGVVAGFSAGCPVISANPPNTAGVDKHYVPVKDLHPSFPPDFKYSKVNSAHIKEAQTHLKDKAAEIFLARDGFKIGQKVHWCRSKYDVNHKHHKREMIIVGHDGNRAVVAFNDINGMLRSPDIAYKSDYSSLHSKWTTKFPVFAIDKDVLQTKEQFIAQEKQDLDNRKILSELSVLGLKLGEKVEYSVDRGNNPLHLPPSDNSKYHLGTIVGCSNGIPVIETSASFTGAWSEKECPGVVHSSFHGSRCWSIRAEHLRSVQPLSPPPPPPPPRPVVDPWSAYMGRNIPASTRLSELHKILEGFNSHPILKGSHSFPWKVVTPSKKEVSPLKADLKKAGYRIVAKQTLRITHGTIVNALKKAGAPNGNIEALSNVLDTEYGKAAIAIVVGIGLEQVKGSLPSSMVDPNETVSNPGHVTNIAKEFRISGMTIAGNELIETIFKSALEVMLNQSSDSKVRVASEDSSLEDYLTEDDEIERKKRSA